MKVMITTEGSGLDAPTSPRFGRCPVFVFVETETMAIEAFPNPAVSAAGGAGIQAAQFVVERGAQAVLTGNVGPNAAEVLQAASVPVYLNDASTVAAAIEAYKAGRLSVAEGATVAAHAGMGGGRRGGQKPPALSTTARDQEIAALRDSAADLRSQLAEILDRITELEKEA